MNKKAFALVAIVLVSAAGIACADDGQFKGRANTVGIGCRNNTWFEIEANITGPKVEGTLLGSAFQRGPVKYAGDATATTFAATYTFTAANNLKVEISGVRVDDETWTISTKWNGGGISNCESSGPAKKA